MAGKLEEGGSGQAFSGLRLGPQERAHEYLGCIRRAHGRCDHLVLADQEAQHAIMGAPRIERARAQRARRCRRTGGAARAHRLVGVPRGDHVAVRAVHLGVLHPHGPWPWRHAWNLGLASGQQTPDPVVQYGDAGLEQRRHAGGPACGETESTRTRARLSVGGRSVRHLVPRGPAGRMASAPRCRVRDDERARKRLLLCPDRRAWPALARRARRVAEDRGAHAHAGGGADRGAPQHRALHGVLALSAPGVAGDVRLVVVYLTQRISRMAEDASIAGQPAAVQGLGGVAADWSGDKQAFPVPWGKVMMWIFLLSDTFIFSCFLTSYMNVRMSTTATWPDPSKVFELEIFGHDIPLLLIAIMTMVLITSSGTMALAVNYGYRRDRARTTALMLATAALGASFVSMQAFEWHKLIVEEGVRPWSNPMGAPQFGSAFFMITGFHGLHVSAGVVYLSVVARRVWTGFYDRKGTYETVEVTGLYWHFVDLVWVFIFAFFYLW